MRRETEGISTGPGFSARSVNVIVELADALPLTQVNCWEVFGPLTTRTPLMDGRRGAERSGTSPPSIRRTSWNGSVSVTEPAGGTKAGTLWVGSPRVSCAHATRAHAAPTAAALRNT